MGKAKPVPIPPHCHAYKQPKQSVWSNYKHKPKVENSKRKERENTKEFVYPVRSKLT